MLVDVHTTADAWCMVGIDKNIEAEAKEAWACGSCRIGCVEKEMKSEPDLWFDSFLWRPFQWFPVAPSLAQTASSLPIPQGYAYYIADAAAKLLLICSSRSATGFFVVVVVRLHPRPATVELLDRHIRQIAGARRANARGSSSFSSPRRPYCDWFTLFSFSSFFLTYRFTGYECFPHFPFCVSFTLVWLLPNFYLPKSW